jgi:DNA-binding MarR family transcriptional regulator
MLPSYAACVTADRELLALWRNVHHMNAIIRTALSERLDADSSCSLIEHDLMAWLEVGASGRRRMLDLAGLLAITQGGITRLVDRLIARGWVQREQLPDNRREIYARLTVQGSVVLAQTRRTYFAALRQVIPQRLDDRDIAALTTLAGKFIVQPGPDASASARQGCGY